MKKPTDADLSFERGGPQDADRSLLSDLMGLISLITRLQTSIAFSERAVATVGLDEEKIDDTVFVLDDVSPRYATANAALNACHAALGEALCHLLETKMSGVSPRPACAATVHEWRI
jgi:hypothetical protein